MSYDVYIDKKEEDEFDGNINYTYNAYHMLNLALSEGANSEIDSINKFNGMECVDVLEITAKMLSHMSDINNEIKYICLEPGNGWGNLSGTKRFVEEIHNLCQENIGFKLRVS